MIKLNLASGQRPFKKPWVNIDLIPQTGSDGKQYELDIQTNANDLHMFKNESVDVIVAHHLVEHIAIHDLEGFITEWRRVLKPGGRLAIFVPNIREIDRAWIEGKISTFIHNVNTYGAYQGHVEDLHKWAYDKLELVDRMSGFDGMNRKFDWSAYGDITPAMMQLPEYQGADCAFDWWILAVEFKK